MLGEIMDIVKLIVDMYKGNIAPTQLYTVIVILLGAAFVDFFIELTKHRGTKSCAKILFESIGSSIIGFTLYIGFYLSVLKIPTYYLDNPEALTDSVKVWIAISGCISFLLLFSMFYLFKRTTSHLVKGLIVIVHIVLTVLLMLAMNQLWIPQIELPISILALTAIFNTFFSIFFIVFGATDHEAKSEQIPGF